MNRHVPTIFLVFLWGIGSARPLGGEETSSEGKEKECILSFRFQPGETIRWKVVHRATVRTTIQGTTQTAQTLSESVKVWKIVRVAPDRLDLVHSVEQVKMTNRLPNRSENRWDSTKDRIPPPGFEEAAKAVGVPLTEFSMTPSGEILRRKEKHAQSVPQQRGPIAIRLPDEPVAVGHVWTEPQQIVVRLKDGTARSIDIRRRCELTGIKHGVATISVEYVPQPIRDPAVEVQIVQQLRRGTIKFDIDAGRVRAQQMDLDKRVIGFSGPASSMHYRMRLTEELIAEPHEVARKGKRSDG